MTTGNPILVAAMINRRKLLEAILMSPFKHGLSEEQEELLYDVLEQLKAELSLPARPTPWDWHMMDHPDIEKIKAAATQILVFVPRKLLPSVGAKVHKQYYPPRLALVRWSHAVEPSIAVTPSRMSLELDAKHGGFWAADWRGIKPLKGAPFLWTYLPNIEGLG